MLKNMRGPALALFVLASAPGVSLAENGPLEALSARCKAEHFQEADQATCVSEQRNALNGFMPIVDFITNGEYLMQSLFLGQCLELTKDYYGQNYIALAACYDEAATTSCKGNSQCLANSTIEGIRTHVRNGTRP
jgi:hypothetical protein